MARNSKSAIPEAREALDRFKMEAASEVGVNLKQGYNGHLTSREAGSVGGQMVKKMIESYEKNMKYKHGESYGIPYRSLCPVGLDNLLVAGRCIGTDRSMEATVRVMPACFMTGHAAGTAAAMAADSGDIRKVDPKVLRERLIAAGSLI